jgi:very-short-patch-repair endonuclease
VRVEKIPGEILRRARELRREQTEAERLLWRMLRGRQLGGYKFRRQRPFGPYILDFYCPNKRLAVELDGGQHASAEQVQYDIERTEYLHKAGIHVLRFWNHQVLQEPEAVLQEILSTLQRSPPSPQPSPASGRGSNHSSPSKN